MCVGIFLNYYVPQQRPLLAGDSKVYILNRSILSNGYLAFGSVIEGVPNNLLWVSYEDTFLLGNVVISKKFLRTRKIMVMA